MLICTLNQVLHSAVIPPVHSCLRRQFFTKNTATLKDNYLIWLILTAENSPKFWNTVSVCAPSLALLERSSDQYLGQYELRGWSQWPKLFQCFLLAHTFVFPSLSWNQMTNPVTVLVTVIVKCWPLTNSKITWHPLIPFAFHLSCQPHLDTFPDS